MRSCYDLTESHFGFMYYTALICISYLGYVSEEIVISEHKNGEFDRKNGVFGDDVFREVPITQSLMKL